MDNDICRKRPLSIRKVLTAAIALSFYLPATVLMALFRGGGNIKEK